VTDPASNVVPVTPDDAKRILALIKHNEPTLSLPTTAEEVRGLCETWARGLAGVDRGWVASYVERRYQRESEEPLRIGEIRRAWRTWCDRVDREVQRVEATSTTEAPEFKRLVGAMPSWARQLYEDCRAAIARGEDPNVTVPEPRYAPVVMIDRDRWARACKERGCICDHTDCRDGWSDREATATDRWGGARHGVVRCPTCSDAVTMRVEAAPPKKQPRWR
jgi:hypothetical protein